MKFGSITFKAPQIKAILAGTMTQTRRLMRIQPPEDSDTIVCGFYSPSVIGKRGEAGPGLRLYGAYSLDGEYGLRSPYGAPCEQLWVKEAFALHHADEIGPNGKQMVAYRATDDAPSPATTWRSALLMPRWASRMTLEITNVRAQRLQEIGDADMICEGVSGPPGQRGSLGSWWTADAAAGPDLHSRTVRGAYKLFWEKIHGPGSWDANPWLWALTFRRLEKS